MNDDLIETIDDQLNPESIDSMPPYPQRGNDMLSVACSTTDAAAVLCAASDTAAVLCAALSVLSFFAADPQPLTEAVTITSERISAHTLFFFMTLLPFCLLPATA